MSVWRGVALLVSVCLLAACQAAKEARTGEEPVAHYTDWTYSNFTGKNGQVTYVAETTTSTGQVDPSVRKKLPSMFIYTSQRNCSGNLVAVGLDESPRKFAKSEQFRNLQGEVRVDDEKPHKVEYQYEVKAGDTDYFLDFPGFFNNETLKQEMRKGQMIRFRLTLGKEERVLKFTLRNILPAVTAVQRYCEEAAAFGAATPARPSGSGGGPPGRPGQPAPEDRKFFQ